MKIIIKAVAGSHLFGTNTESSDADFKGVYMPDARDIFLQKVKDTIRITTGGDKDKNTKEPRLTSLTVTRGIGAIMPTRQEMINIKRDDKLKRILSSEK